MKKMTKATLIFALMVFFAGACLSVHAAETIKIDINKATAKDLTTLKNIGPKTAASILEYRKANGSFKTIDDLLKVKGIGEKKFKSIKDMIMVLDTSKEKVKQDKDKDKTPKKENKPKKSG